LAGDVQYTSSLVLKSATEGYTLTPREVRSARRTGKDVLTFIPFLIILITPLTPVGHVLIFSFIQRFFPDFFPTPYTDQRQNLLKLYETIEEKEEDGVVVDEMQEAIKNTVIAAAVIAFFVFLALNE